MPGFRYTPGEGGSMKNPNRMTYIQFRVTTKERREIKKIAKRSGTTVSGAAAPADAVRLVGS